MEPKNPANQTPDGGDDNTVIIPHDNGNAGQAPVPSQEPQPEPQPAQNSPMPQNPATSLQNTFEQPTEDNSQSEPVDMFASVDQPNTSNQQLPQNPVANPAVAPAEYSPVSATQAGPDQPVATQSNLGATHVVTDEIGNSLEQPSERKKPLRLKMMLLILAGVVVVVVVAVIVSTLSKPATGYKRVSLNNKGYTYSFLFDPKATSAIVPGKVVLAGDTYLLGYNVTKSEKISVVVSPSPYNTTCIKQYNFLTQFFTFTVSGEKYPACTDTGNNAILGSYKFDGTWQQIGIYAPPSKGVDIKTAEAIMGSIRTAKS